MSSWFAVVIHFSSSSQLDSNIWADFLNLSPWGCKFCSHRTNVTWKHKVTQLHLWMKTYICCLGQVTILQLLHKEITKCLKNRMLMNLLFFPNLYVFLLQFHLSKSYGRNLLIQKYYAYFPHKDFLNRKFLYIILGKIWILYEGECNRGMSKENYHEQNKMSVKNK